MVFLIPLFCGLGIWQLDRAEQKRQLAAALESRRKLPPLSLNRETPRINELEFRSISADGRFLAKKSVLIENRKHLGKNGFHVITPLQLAGTEQIVLVNRGWVPRARLTDMMPLTTPSVNLRVTGEIALPQPPALALEFTQPESEDVPRWPYLTLDHFAQWSGLKILPFAVLQSPADSGGFVRQWPQPRISDGMHIGYAIQWFSFALITLLIWLRLSLPKQPPQQVTLL